MFRMSTEKDGCVSCTDGIMPSSWFGNDKKKETDADSASGARPIFPSVVIDPNSNRYDLSRPKRGLAVIFNHYKFDDYSLSKRVGTEKDCKDLKKQLEKLGFEVVIHDDLKYGAISDILQELSQADHTDENCLLIMALTHGEQGRLYAKDHQYPADELWNPFVGDKCPTLVGKPKLFFLQACRGTEIDDGVPVRARTVKHDSGISYAIPVMADILVMYSTYDGFFSWRSPVSGSWFVQCLCAELEIHAENRDLMTILTFVNRRMALSYQSNVPTNPNMHRKKQIGTITSTLTKLLYFYNNVEMETD